MGRSRNDIIIEMIDQIKRCIERFASDMSLRLYKRELQTFELLSRVGQIGSRMGLEVAYTDSDAGRSEWLYDLTFLRRENVAPHFLQRVELALESEWDDGCDAIMVDFDKLLQARAVVKVMVCRRQSFDIANVFLRAVEKYPGKEPCTYLFAICDFENPSVPVRFVECDERGVRKGATLSETALKRYLALVNEDVFDMRYELAFEGFWPNKKSGFVSFKTGLYFVFIGRRRVDGTGFVAELARLIFIGTAQNTEALASVSNGGRNVFEGLCRGDEIPYYAFATIAGGDLQSCYLALLWHFKPEVNAFKELFRKPAQRISIAMTGDVADCLGVKTFIV